VAHSERLTRSNNSPNVKVDCDITAYAWLEHDSVGLLATSHVQSFALFHNSVVRPSLAALDQELQALRSSDDPSSVFLEDDYVELFQKTLEGFLLATQSMWERGLRQLLTDRDKKLRDGANARALQNARWSAPHDCLQTHFEDLFGLPLTAFDTYSDLDLLQSLANAIRHGDGASSQKVYRACPGLWLNWLQPCSVIEGGPFTIRVPPDAPAFPPFDSITLPEALLEQMIQSVVWFWDDIEHMRCNSFRRKHPTVEQKIERWRGQRRQRLADRHWTPSV
jgi:hypothetical protein